MAQYLLETMIQTFFITWGIITAIVIFGLTALLFSYLFGCIALKIQSRRGRK